MDNILNTIKETPEWVYGAIGIAAITYNFWSKNKDASNTDLVSLTLSGAATCAACMSVPMITPVLVASAVYDDYHRRKNQKD